MAQDLRIITTGGTFDKQYDAVKGELTFRESQLPRILGQARCTLTVHLEGPLAVDSLYMTEEQRGETARVIAKKTTISLPVESITTRGWKRGFS